MAVARPGLNPEENDQTFTLYPGQKPSVEGGADNPNARLDAAVAQPRTDIRNALARVAEGGAVSRKFPVNPEREGKSFVDTIRRDVPMSFEEAVQALMNFHKASAEDVGKVFPDLARYAADTDVVIFRGAKTINDIPYLQMGGYDKDGTYLWGSGVASDSGQPKSAFE